jgi:hypothetical protein
MRAFSILPFRRFAAFVLASACVNGTSAPILEVGLAKRDITPEGPIWLAGYAARKKPSEKVDSPLLVEAIAFRGSPASCVVLVALDNCEVSHAFTAPVLRQLEEKHDLGPGHVIIVSSHTHSGPVVQGPLLPMYPLSPEDRAAVEAYGHRLQEQLLNVVSDALADLQPAILEHGVGRTTFATNRRVYDGDKIGGGENLDGPVDWDVPVLRIKGTNNMTRAILFGYACHGTSIHGDDFYVVSGDYMAYARQQLEAVYPGVMTAYFTGMGADSNPAPRGKLTDAKRHGLELAGAVASVLDRPMRSVGGPLRLAYDEVDLSLAPCPSREQLENDAQNQDSNIRQRATAYLGMLDHEETPPKVVRLPLAALRIGHDLTFVLMGGEVVVDYGTRFKRLFADDHPWLIGYAYEVPCYIPSIRIIKEGGYEAESSLIYYGMYGPFQSSIESMLVNKMTDLVSKVRVE